MYFVLLSWAVLIRLGWYQGVIPGYLEPKSIIFSTKQMLRLGLSNISKFSSGHHQPNNRRFPIYLCAAGHTPLIVSAGDLCERRV